MFSLFNILQHANDVMINTKHTTRSRNKEETSSELPHNVANNEVNDDSSLLKQV